MMNIQLQIQNTKLQLENIELQYKNSGFISDLGTVNTSFELIDIGLELLKVGMGINPNLIPNQIFQFQMKLQNIILKFQNMENQNQNMGMNPLINNNMFFNNELENEINSNNKKKINVRFKNTLGSYTNIVSNYETPINEVIEKYLNRIDFPKEKRKKNNIHFFLRGYILKENDQTSIGNYCNNGECNLVILVNDAEHLRGGKE